MFRCLQSSRVTHDTSSDVIARSAELSSNELSKQCERFNRPDLIRLCKHLAIELQKTRTEARYLQASKEDMCRAHAETIRATNLLQTELREKSNQLGTKMRALEQERLLAERTEKGLRAAVIRQERQITDIRADLSKALSSEIKAEALSSHGGIDTLATLCKQTIDQMEECLSDPVSLDRFNDPVTIESGHTYNRSTLIELAIRSRDLNRIQCPISKAWIRKAVNREKSIIATNMMDICDRLKAGLGNM